MESAIVGARACAIVSPHSSRRFRMRSAARKAIAAKLAGSSGDAAATQLGPAATARRTAGTPYSFLDGEWWDAIDTKDQRDNEQREHGRLPPEVTIDDNRAA